METWVHPHAFIIRYIGVLSFLQGAQNCLLLFTLGIWTLLFQIVKLSPKVATLTDWSGEITLWMQVLRGLSVSHFLQKQCLNYHSRFSPYLLGELSRIARVAVLQRQELKILSAYIILWIPAKIWVFQFIFKWFSSISCYKRSRLSYIPPILHPNPHLRPRHAHLLFCLWLW